jgi:hypothetical protein
MTRNFGCALGGALFIALGCCGTAQAAPIVLEYSGVADGHVGDPNPVVPGVTPGETISFHVTADNGNAGLASQSWDWTDITSATITAGSYTATLSGPVSGGFGGFSTDATGHLLTLNFGVGQDGTDSNGGTPVSYFMDGFNSLLIDNLGRDFGAVMPPDISNTSIAAAPIPASLPLLISALGGLGFAGWRRKRAA